METCAVVSLIDPTKFNNVTVNVKIIIFRYMLGLKMIQFILLWRIHTKNFHLCDALKLSALKTATMLTTTL